MAPDSLKGKKVLIVEDDFSSRLYLNKILERAEIITLNAADGQEAVDAAASDPGIDVILLDIQLPVFDGYETARRIRESGNNVIIIAQTAYGLMDEKEKIMGSGFDDFLIKPIVHTLLLEKLRTILAKREA